MAFSGSVDNGPLNSSLKISSFLGSQRTLTFDLAKITKALPIMKGLWPFQNLLTLIIKQPTILPCTTCISTAYTFTVLLVVFDILGVGYTWICCRVCWGSEGLLEGQNIVKTRSGSVIDNMIVAYSNVNEIQRCIRIQRVTLTSLF